MSSVRGYTIFWILLLLLLAVGASAAQTADTKEGVTIELDAQSQDQMQEIVQTAADALPRVEATSEVGLLVTPDGEQWIIAAEKPIKTGQTTVSGDAYKASNIPGVDYNVIFASEVETTTRGEPVSFEELRNNPEQYHNQLVRVTGDYSQLAYALEVGEGKVVEQSTLAVMNAPDTDTEPVPPGKIGRWSTMNLSDSSFGASRSNELSSRLGEETKVAFLDYASTRFWMQTESQVDVVVRADGNRGARLYVADVTPTSQPASVDEVAAGNRDGDVVTVDADAAYLKMSTKQTLLKVSRCAPDSISNPITGCLPVVTDAVVHGGVLYDGVPDGPQDMVLFAGVSNLKQDSAFETGNRRLKVTGKVVNGSEISPAFENMRAIVVYDIEPVNHNEGRPPDEAVAQRKQFRESMTQQMNGSGSSSEKSQSQSTSTAEDESGNGEVILEVQNPPTADQEDPVAQKGEKFVLEITVTNIGDGVFEGTLVVEDQDEHIYGNSDVNIKIKPGESLKITSDPTANWAGTKDLRIVDMDGNILAGAGSIYIEPIDRGETTKDKSDIEHYLGEYWVAIVFGLLSTISLISMIILAPIQMYYNWRDESTVIEDEHLGALTIGFAGSLMIIWGVYRSWYHPVAIMSIFGVLLFGKKGLGRFVAAFKE